MGKRRQITSEEEQRDSTTTGSTSPKKKHKHKHKKHKRKRELTESESLIEDEIPKKKKRKRKEKEKDEGRSLKLRIKLGGRTLATKQVLNVTPVTLQPPSTVGSDEESEKNDDPVTVTEPWKEEPESTVDVKPSKSSEDQEEEEWLDALEAGELDDYGRMKQEKDTSMMTARQRAMLGHEIEGENELLELPTEIRRKDEDSEEAAKRRKQRAKKRKQQMEKQIEDDKAQTIERLLNKQVKSRKEAEKQKRIQKAVVPRVTYLNNANGISISFPANEDIPFKKQAPPRVPKEKVLCAVEGCDNMKRYSCSKTNLPLCSLECYKKVQQTRPLKVA